MQFIESLFSEKDSIENRNFHVYAINAKAEGFFKLCSKDNIVVLKMGFSILSCWKLCNITSALEKASGLYLIIRHSPVGIFDV